MNSHTFSEVIYRKYDDQNPGPDVRPIIGATVAPNIALTDFISWSIDVLIGKLLKKQVLEMKEEFLNKFEQYNLVRIWKGYSSKNVMIAYMDWLDLSWLHSMGKKLDREI